MIKLLQKEIAYLRQYVFYVADYDEVSMDTTVEQQENQKDNQQGSKNSLK